MALAAALFASAALYKALPGRSFVGAAPRPASRSAVALAAEANPFTALPKRFTEDAAAPAAEPAPAVEAEAAPAAEPLAMAEPLFQELFVSNNTTPKKLMGAMVAVFGTGARAVDLVLVDPRCKHTLMYGISSLPAQFEATASVLLRKRDRRLRIRVYQHVVPVEEEDPEMLYVSKTTNVTSLGYVIKSRFVDQIGNNLKKSVKMKFAGKETSNRAIIAIENAMHYANRELAFRPRFVWEDQAAKAPETDAAAENMDGAAAAPGTQTLNIIVSVVAV